MKELLKIALNEFNVSEIPGSQNNPEIMKYSQETGIKNIKDDETPWCSIFANWVTMKGGYERTNRADAASWQNIGIPIDVPVLGCIVLIWGKEQNRITHVGFYAGTEGENINVFGGNQQDRVKYSFFKKDVCSFRLLKKI